MVPTIIIIIVNIASVSAANRDPMQQEIDTAALERAIPIPMTDRPNGDQHTADGLFTRYESQARGDDRSIVSIAGRSKGSDATRTSA